MEVVSKERMLGLGFEDWVQVPDFPFPGLEYNFMSIREMGTVILAPTTPV